MNKPDLMDMPPIPAHMRGERHPTRKQLKIAKYAARHANTPLERGEAVPAYRPPEKPR